MVADSDTLYVGVRRHGIMLCNILTGEVGSIVFHCKCNITDLALGTMCVRARLLHTLNPHTPQCLRARPGLPQHMRSGHRPHSAACIWLWRCCGKHAHRADGCRCHTNLRKSSSSMSCDDSYCVVCDWLWIWECEFEQENNTRAKMGSRMRRDQDERGKKVPDITG